MVQTVITYKYMWIELNAEIPFQIIPKSLHVYCFKSGSFVCFYSPKLRIVAQTIQRSTSETSFFSVSVYEHIKDRFSFIILRKKTLVMKDTTAGFYTTSVHNN